MLLDLEYEFKAEELALASLDFIESRPILKYLFKLMNFLCLIMLIGIALRGLGLPIQVDYFTIFFCCFWTFFRKSVQLKFLTTVKNKEITNLPSENIHITKKYIFSSSKNKQLWKELKKIYKNEFGYIIPKVGLQNSGQFIWLPKRIFKENEENVLLNLLSELKISVKDI